MRVATATANKRSIEEATETLEDTLIPVYQQPAPVSTLANVVEVEYMVYGTFRDHFAATSVKRDYAGTHMYIPCANGQVVRVTVDPLDEREMKEYEEERNR